MISCIPIFYFQLVLVCSYNKFWWTLYERVYEEDDISSYRQICQCLDKEDFYNVRDAPPPEKKELFFW